MQLADKIEDIIEVLQNGGIILYPTDTIWGLGCDATNVEAIEKIYAIKKRPADKPLSVLVDSIKMLKEYVEPLHPRIETLHSFHKKPLTLIYENIQKFPAILTGPNHSVGIRIVQDDFCKEIISEFGIPIVSTSANLSGSDYPTHFGEISYDLINSADYVVKHRREEKGKQLPSVVARHDNKGELIFLRE